jgi:hypothetical protein
VVVEAKGRINEVSAGGCKATGDSLEKIHDAFSDVQADLGIPPTPGWLAGHYQMANRLAFLWFARRRGEEQQLWLVWAYFLGERYPTATGVTVGPTSETEWAPAIQAAKDELRLLAQHDLNQFEVELFLPAVLPQATE